MEHWKECWNDLCPKSSVLSWQKTAFHRISYVMRLRWFSDLYTEDEARGVLTLNHRDCAKLNLDSQHPLQLLVFMRLICSTYWPHQYKDEV